MDVLPVIMSAHHMCALPMEKTSHPLVLKIVSHHVDSGNQTQELGRLASTPNHWAISLAPGVGFEHHKSPKASGGVQ